MASSKEGLSLPSPLLQGGLSRGRPPRVPLTKRRQTACLLGHPGPSSSCCLCMQEPEGWAGALICTLPDWMEVEERSAELQAQAAVLPQDPPPGPLHSPVQPPTSPPPRVPCSLLPEVTSSSLLGWAPGWPFPPPPSSGPNWDVCPLAWPSSLPVPLATPGLG